MIRTAESPAMAHECPTCRAAKGVMCSAMTGVRSQRNEVHHERIAVAEAAILKTLKASEALALIDASKEPPPAQIRDHIRRTAEVDLVASTAWGWSWPRSWPRGRSSRSTAASVVTVDLLKRMRIVQVEGHKCRLTELGRKVAKLIERENALPRP